MEAIVGQTDKASKYRRVVPLNQTTPDHAKAMDEYPLNVARKRRNGEIAVKRSLTD
jgi:hypothetical protein